MSTKILVIDDEKPTLSMFRLFLSAYGYTVFVAENGAAGLEMIEKENPAIVFTDIKMPGMDGFEVLRRIKKMNPATEVVVMTGHGDMDLAVEALNLEATDFINKPIQKAALDSALARAEERLRQTSDAPTEQVGLRNSDGITIMDIKGNVTSHSEKMLTDAYEKASAQGATKLLMRFDETSSVNGAGIAILIQLLSESKKRNQTVAITGISENFKKIFDMVGITKFAKIFDHEADALGSFD